MRVLGLLEAAKFRISRGEMGCLCHNYTTKFVFSTNTSPVRAFLKENSCEDGVALSDLQKRVDSLDKPECQADFFTYKCLLHHCCRLRALMLGRRIHDHIARSGMDRHVYLSNQVVNMYGKCGSVEEAHMVFNKIPGKNVFSWNTLIAAYTRHGQFKEAFELFQRMEQEGVQPDIITFVSILNSCASHATIVEGRLIHKKTVNTIFHRDVTVSNALINMYSKFLNLQESYRIFTGMSKPNIKSWNLVIAGYARNGHVKQALQVFSEMQLRGVKPDRITLVNILNAFSCPEFLTEGKQIHSFIAAIGWQSDVVVGTALLSMYGKCGCLENARILFETMQEPNVVSWTTMMGAYAHQGHGRKALELYKQMHQKGVTPNEITFLTALDACTSIADIEEGKSVHRNIVDHGFQSDIILGNALIHMYSNCGSLEKAKNVFSNMTKKDAASWNTMISACEQHGQSKAAIRLFQLMQQEGFNPNKVTFLCLSEAISSLANLAEAKSLYSCINKSTFASDLAVGNAVVNLFCKCGSIEDAHKVFAKMPKRDVISWSTLILAYVEQGRNMLALELFDDMQRDGLEPNKVLLVSVFNACANLPNLSKGRTIHNCHIDGTLESDLGLGNAIVNMYSKCGALDNARSMFEKMPKRNAISWSAMISAYAQHGHGKVALQLFGQMQAIGEKVDKICSMSILFACSHAGLVDEGSHYFESITFDHAVIPPAMHSGCVVDILGRAGQLGNAERYINL
ncbi:hypothetical protein O6H91_19G045100 [Diphasiastrum complanatum]|nr:hypothetical protein O6H91_19G045100 [Diphasiastrum complanatum]